MADDPSDLVRRWAIKARSQDGKGRAGVNGVIKSLNSRCVCALTNAGTMATSPKSWASDGRMALDGHDSSGRKLHRAVRDWLAGDGKNPTGF